ncbi:FtsK/SpoIIIE domain-containing protein [Nocardia sp. NPDC049220]|uniref:FtsK/SpoIIIE domain-containing protein n=1 Tax=Nocardia sp. NPDC049220 TaxID=3155273 RepID=UPI0033D28ADE
MAEVHLTKEKISAGIGMLGVGACGFGVLWAHQSAGNPGAIAVVGLGGVAAVRYVTKEKEQKQVKQVKQDAGKAAEENRWERYLAFFDPSVHYAVRMLADPKRAPGFWDEYHLTTWADTPGGEPDYPRVTVGATDGGVISTLVGARVRLSVPAGASTEAFANRLDGIAHGLRADVTIVKAGRGFIELDLRTMDPLAKLVMARKSTGLVDLERIPAGLTEEGSEWCVPLLYRNLIIAGVPGAGKSGVLWALLCSLGPQVRAGRVVLWGIDLKFGLELKPAEPMLYRLATTEDLAMKLLKDFKKAMEARGEKMAEDGRRKYVPSDDEPVHVLVIDELINLLRQTNSKASSEAFEILFDIMRRGRSLGFSVIACTQDMDKSILSSLRNVIQIRIGLRMVENSQLLMMYGPGAKDRGADNLRIPEGPAGAGIAYVEEEGSSRLQRCRAGWIPDDEVAALAEEYAIAA